MPVDRPTLEPLIGTWDIEAASARGDWSGTGRTTFEWLLGGTYLLERSQVDHPDAPDSYAILAPAAGGNGWTQHYFDSRGVVRLYEMAFDGREWTLLRRTPDFSPLDFQQRYVGTFSEDGDTIDGQWETSDDGHQWQTDFRLTYRRAR